MHKSRFIITAAAVLALAGVFSCKKNDDTTTLPSLNGTLKFKDRPIYVNPQEEVTFTLSGVTHPEGGTVRYVITVVEGYRTVRDTLDEGVMSMKYTFCDRKYFNADTLRDVTVTGTAFAEGYYSSSTGTVDVFVVKGGLTGGSINGILLNIGDESVSADGTTYYTRDNGEAGTWLRQNIAKEDKGVPYLNSPAMLDVFGSFLSWEDAKNACPAGYRLTTDEDWVKIAKAVGSGDDAKVHETISGTVAPHLMADATFNYEQSSLWTYWKGMDIDDKAGLSILPTGYANLSSGSFSGVQQIAAFWTADENDADTAWYRYINEKSPELFAATADKKSFGASVRCVKE